MSPEELHRHTSLKASLAAFLCNHTSRTDSGQTFISKARFTSIAASISCQPDVLFVSWETLESGRARFVQTSKKHPGHSHEIEGSADLVVEVVSESSVNKDTRLLPPLYAKAKVREFWLANALGETLAFQIFHLHRGRYRKAAVDAEGF